MESDELLRIIEKAVRGHRRFASVREAEYGSTEVSPYPRLEVRAKDGTLFHVKIVKDW